MALLDKAAIKDEENILRDRLSSLSESNKKKYYSLSDGKLKDPDTYAALGYIFLFGLHHLYLKNYINAAAINILALFGIVLLFNESYGLGIVVLLIASIWEIYGLFNSQAIVAKYNNAITKKIITSVEKESVKI